MSDKNGKPDFRVDLTKALDSLQKQHLIAFNTENGWIIAGDATSDVAVHRLLQIAAAHPAKDSVVLLENVARLQSYAEDIPEIAWDLMEVSDDKLLLVLDQPKNISEVLISAKLTLAFKVSTNTFMKYLLQRFRKPLFSVEAFVDQSIINSYLKTDNDNIVEFNSKFKQYSAPFSVIKIGKGNKVEILRK